WHARARTWAGDQRKPDRHDGIQRGGAPIQNRRAPPSGMRVQGPFRRGARTRRARTRLHNAAPHRGQVTDTGHTMKTLQHLCALVALVLAGCSTTSPDVIKRDDAQRMSNVLDGVVISTRPVTVEGSQSGVGAAAGGVVGGVAGSTVGSGKGRVVGGTIGAVAGGVAGNAIERQVTREDAVEIIVQLKSGERRAIVQARGSDVIKPGDAVIIITENGHARVIKAPHS